MKIDDILYEVSKKKEFGEIPSYYIEYYKDYFWLWRNDGQIPSTRDIDEVESLSGSSGFATFVGVFSMDEILYLLKEGLL